MKLLKHVMFWLAILALLTLIFGQSYKNYTESFYFVSMLLPVSMGTAYFFNYFLVPRYLLKRKYFTFSLYVVYLLIVSLNFEMYVITGAFIVLAEYNYANMNPVTTDVFVLTISLYFIVFGLSFVRLVQFYFQNEKSLQDYESAMRKNDQKHLTIKENRKNVQITLTKITHIESLGDYVKIHSNDSRQVITKEKISSLIERLPDDFLRIHRSIIINKNHMTSYNKELVFLGKIQLPISRTFKNDVHSSLNI